MSSDLQSTLQSIQLGNYASVMVFTAVGYDYFLTFSREINYVWCRPWSWVSTMFILVRYLGLCWAILNALDFSSFTADLKICTVNYLASAWLFLLFLAAADLVMILRVYAMWDQSKMILRVLLSIYVPEVVIAFIFTGIYGNPSAYFSVTIIQLPQFTHCNYSYDPPVPLWSYLSPNFFLGLALLILAVTQTLKQSFYMYKVTKTWQPNQYMKLLVRDGIIYFLVNVIFDVPFFVSGIGGTLNASMQFLALLVCILLCSMMPRFIISVRELYDHDTCRQQGIDTGFGISSQLDGHNAAVSAIAFADVTPGEDQVMEGDGNDSEAIRLEAVGGGAHRV